LAGALVWDKAPAKIEFGELPQRWVWDKDPALGELTALHHIP